MSQSLFEEVLGQPEAVSYLKTCIEKKMVTGSYLFTGAAGSGKADGAWAFAQGILCPQGGGDSCDDCIRVAHRTHPDVHFLAPESAVGYLVEQIRDLIADVSMAPMRATQKVYIIDGADRLRDAGANALLKTLEEPPDNVTFILLAPGTNEVLTTIVSRCQNVPFHSVGPQSAISMLETLTGMPRNSCARAFAATGSVTLAKSFMGQATSWELRQNVLSSLGRILTADDLDILKAIESILKATKAPLEVLKKKQDGVIKEYKDDKYLSSGALKRLEERHKRELTAAQREQLKHVLGVMRSYFRDVTLVQLGRCAQVANDDALQSIQALANSADMSVMPTIVVYIDEAALRIRRNVTPQLALEACLFKIKEALTCRQSYL